VQKGKRKVVGVAEKQGINLCQPSRRCDGFVKVCSNYEPRKLNTFGVHYFYRIFYAQNPVNFMVIYLFKK
jgi:hypothetical protein